MQPRGLKHRKSLLVHSNVMYQSSYPLVQVSLRSGFKNLLFNCLAFNILISGVVSEGEAEGAIVPRRKP